MELEDWLRFAHVIGATVLFGTGAGIAFFMVMARRTTIPSYSACLGNGRGGRYRVHGDCCGRSTGDRIPARTPPRLAVDGGVDRAVTHAVRAYRAFWASCRRHANKAQKHRTTGCVTEPAPTAALIPYLSCMVRLRLPSLFCGGRHPVAYADEAQDSHVELESGGYISWQKRQNCLYTAQ